MSAKSGMCRAALAAGGSLAVLAATTVTATAGGFDVREQSALFQGMSFAGAAAGGTSLAAMFWNPSAAGYVGDGLTFDSSYSLILPRADLTVETVDLGGGPVPLGLTPFAGTDNTVDVGRDAIVPASYMAYRYSRDLVFALSINSQFGLGTKPDNTNWTADIVGRSSKLFSVNAAPTVAYQIAPGVQVGAGVQIQYLDLMHFKSATAPAFLGHSPSATLEGTDWGFGYTLGLNVTPAAGTSIGIGFRSSIDHDLEGTLRAQGAGLGIVPIGAGLELPEKITGSLRQDIVPGVRAHATVEWTNWSRLNVVPVVTEAGGVMVANLDFHWDDGWYFALGGEYDYSETLTLRAGVGYEISPVQEAFQRLVQLPDNDRVWLSAGASYKVGDLMGLLKDATIDMAYTHIFVEAGDFARRPASVMAPPLTFGGSVEASVDILSIGVRSKF